ncbi:MAG: flagellar hook-length control protein FliK [Sphingomonadaceae bacterium]|nr:flagellar hook-length control protein FliK [Sphingomonadaceae bacterium]
MASIPNMPATPCPVPAGKGAAPANGAANFADRLANVPIELVRIAAETLTGGAGGEPADAEADRAKADDADGAEPAAVPSDAAQLAALTPVLQSLPAMLPAAVLAPAQTPTTAAAPEVQPKVDMVAAQVPVASATVPAAMAAALPNPAPITASTSAPAPAGKLKLVKPDAQNAAVEADSDAETGEQPAAAPEAQAKDVVAAARRAIEAAFRPAKAPAAEDQPQAAHAAARPAAPAPQTGKEAPAPSPELIATPLPDNSPLPAFAASTAPAPTLAAAAPTAQPAETGAPAPDRTLDLTNDAEWLDRLARDIAQASGDDGAIRFRLHPQTLGHIQVEVAQGERGASVRITADSEQARNIIADAQPRLVAEARAQGVRIAETHVDLSGSDRQASGDPRRQGENIPTPLIRTARDAAAGEDSPDRPARSRSDRYA